MDILGLGSEGKIHVHGAHREVRGPHFKRKVWELFEGEKTQAAVRAAYNECFANGTPQEVMVNNSVLRFVKADVPPQVLAWMEKRREPAEPHPLDDRELEVLRLYADGLTTQQVCQRLDTSDATVRKLRESIAMKLGMSGTVTEACVWAARQGLL